jgi:phage tail-like protein
VIASDELMEVDGMSNGTRVDPYKNFNFRVEIDSMTIAGFSECTGLETEVAVIEYREGGDFLTRKLPGRPKYGDITLKRGVAQPAELEHWHRKILDGVPDRRNGVIILLDDERSEVVRWRFFNAFPRKWEGPALRAEGNDVAIEALVLSCERIEREGSQ